jgi:hypothetical protein
MQSAMEGDFDEVPFMFIIFVCLRDCGAVAVSGRSDPEDYITHCEAGRRCLACAGRQKWGANLGIHLGQCSERNDCSGRDYA